MKEIYLAGGCFWGTEHYFKQIRGVTATEVGFANGRIKNPSYRQVCTEDTGFAETVRIPRRCSISPPRRTRDKDGRAAEFKEKLVAL